MKFVEWATPVVFCVNVYLLFEIVKYGEDVHKNDSKSGYWGEKTANTNWCEPDYIVTPYIAEFWNTLSSFFVVIDGLYGIYYHCSWAETRYGVAWLLFLVVGLGSVMFHATLQRGWQLMDELPMVWANSVFIYVVHFIERKDDTRRERLFGMVFVAVYAAVSTVLIILYDTEDQVVFLVAYGSGVMWLMYSSIVLRKKYKTDQGVNVDLGLWGVFIYLFGFMVWLTDRRYCSIVQSWQMHSVWHFCAGLGTYIATLFWLQVRELYKGEHKLIFEKSLRFTRVAKAV
eukprot:Stramenopile-MAST_4_protein_1444